MKSRIQSRLAALWDDSRAAVSITIVKGLAILFLVGIVYIMVNRFFQPMRTEFRSHTTNETALKGMSWIGQTGWDNFLFFATGLSVLGVIAFAVFASQGVR